MQADSVVSHQQPQSSPFLHQVSGFLRHPDHSPVALRALPPWRQRRRACSDLGLVCFSTCHLVPGTWIELTIPVRHYRERFLGRVVMVRATEAGYDIGLCLAHEEDAARLRIIEQFCHMESYCRCTGTGNRRGARETRARDWVARFAATFPSL